jgi:hypothetical protein
MTAPKVSSRKSRRQRHFSGACSSAPSVHRVSRSFDDASHLTSVALPHVSTADNSGVQSVRPDDSKALTQGAIHIWHNGCMKKTLHIDEQLLREAKSAAGARTDTDTVRLGLKALIRRAAYDRLRALRGSEPRARDVRRRRERSSSARHSAA